jgi:hypothetical protein
MEPPMHNEGVAHRLRLVLRQEIADCERAIRGHDPVRALNDLADAATRIKSIVRELESGRPTDG